MGPKRFVAATAAEALKKIKAELGTEAIVLSNREVPEGIEIVAIDPEALKALAHGNTVTPTRAPAEPPRAVVTSAPAATSVSPRSFDPPRAEPERTPQRELAFADSESAAARATVTAPAEPHPQRIEPQLAPRPQPAAPATPPPAQQDNAQLVSQLAEVRSMLETHLAGNFWGQMQQHAPAHAEMTKRLLNSGFSPKVCSQLLDGLPATERTEALLDTVQKRLAEQIQTLDPFEMFDAGGVFAFIGPTGVGKTTTVAKVAARCVLRYGRDQVALLTTDTYRIGAQEQLRVFAKILGLPVIALRDSEDLQGKLQDLSKRRIVLLDTAGVSQRDTMMVEQLKLIGNGCRDVRRILVLSATTSLRTLEEVIQAHRKVTQSQGLFASVITKVDEAATIAPAVDCMLRNELPLLFLSNGQRVPEDLYPPNLPYLAHRTVRPRNYDSSADMGDSEMPALIADNLAAWTRKVMA